MYVSVDQSGKFLSLMGADSVRQRYHAIWLRDNAQDEATRSTQNGQRLIALQDIPDDLYIESATLDDNSLRIRFQPESVSIDYSLNWLSEHAYDMETDKLPGWVDDSTELWNNLSVKALPSISFAELVENRNALMNWLEGVRRFGVGRVNDGPVDADAILRVVDQFGFVRKTNYGDVFDVRTELNPTNLAYTGLGLQAHTDNPYRDPVPTLQILYCLENSAEGGESMVVDGFYAAKQLQQENLEWFNVFTKYCARFEYAGSADVHLKARKPMIELSPDGEIIAIRFNNRSCAPTTDVPFDQMETFYAAYRRFGELIDQESAAVTFKLSPGDCFVVDNTRVLHARKGYSGAGSRWLRGCYADKDGLYSTLSSLKSEQNGV